MSSQRLSKNNQGRRHRQKGGNVVESALVLLTMLCMILFIMDMGRMLLMQQFITERARTTVRQAVVNNWTSDQVKNVLVYNSTTAGSGAGFLGLQTSEVTYNALGNVGDPDYRLQVVVSGVPMLTWIPYIAGSYNAPPITVTMPAQSLGATN